MRYNHFDMLPERAFQRDVSGKIKPQGGGGGSSSPSKSTVTQTNIPEYARPYAEETLGRAQALTDINQNPFQPYSDQRFAGFSPMQAEAFSRISGQQVSPQITDASNIAYTAAGQALRAQPTAQQLQQEAQRYGGIASGIGITGAQQAQQASQQAQQQAQMYGGLGAGYGGAAASMVPQAQMYGGLGAGYGAQGVGIGGIGVQAAQQGFGAGQAYAEQATSPEAQQAYMSPYMQNVVKQQQEDARRQALISRQAEQAQAVKQGAFGGSRSAIVEAESRKNLEDRLAQIQATGSQQAFQQAQQAQQFGAGLGIQGLQAGYQGLQTGLAGTAQGMQGAQTGLQGIQQAGQLYGLGMQGAGLGLQGVGQQIAGGQLGIAGGQLGISGQQAGLQGVGQATGAGQYGLQGAQTAIQGAGQLGQLGQTQYAQEMGITDALQKYGALQQQQQQQALDFAYQQYLAQQQYPYQQLSYMSDILRGVPSTQSAVYQYQQQPAVAPQLLGAGLSAYGAFARGSKEGGQIKRYADGGQVTPDAMNTMAVQELPGKLRRLSDTQLAAYARNVKDAITLSAIQGELNRRTRSRAPMGQPQDTTLADDIAKRAQAASLGGPVGMAGGGIVALNGESGSRVPYVRRGPMGVPTQSMTQEDLDQLPQVGDRRSLGLANLINPGAVSPYAVGVPDSSGETIGPQGMQPIAESAPVDSGEAVADQGATTSPSPQDKSGIAGASQKSAAVTTESAGAPASSTSAKAPASRTGIAQARPSAGVMSYEEWQKQAAPKGISPEDQAVLNDMKSRVDKRIERAGKSEDTAKYDAIMMAGLAMMSGTSLADGIAKAAQMGGATYMQGKDKAAKALDAAEEADLAFQKYKLELNKGNKKEARESFNDFMTYSAKLEEIAGRERVAQINAGARGGAGGGITFPKAQAALNANKDYQMAQGELKAATEVLATLANAKPGSKVRTDAEAKVEAAKKRVTAIQDNFFKTLAPEVYSTAQQVYGFGGAGGANTPAAGTTIRYDAQGNKIQ